MSRQGEKTRLLLFEGIGDGAPIITGPGAAVGDLVAPGARLTVEVGERGERARREEALADVAYSPLDAPFFRSPRRPAGAGLEVIVRAQLDKTRMEVDRIASSLEHGRAQVVVQDGPGNAAQLLEGAHVAPQEVLEALVEEELQRQGAGVGQCQHEARQAPLRPSDTDLAEVRPISLRLVSRKRTKRQEGFPMHPWAQPRHDAAQLHNATQVATGADHLIDPRRAQIRILLET